MPERVAWNVDSGSASFVVARDVKVDHPTLDRTCKDANWRPDCEPLLVLSARKEVGKEFGGFFDVMERDDDISQLSVRARLGLQWF